MDKSLSKKREINWPKVLYQLQLNTSIIIAAGYLYKNGCMWKTFFFGLQIILWGALGQLAGAHRLWAHGAYSASTGLKVFLMICQTLTGHGSIYDWVLWHRLHHKYYGTDLDPYNHKNGFFFSHLVGLVRQLSDAQVEAMKEIDMSDLENDKVVMFQKKYYNLLYVIVTLLLPVNAPCEYWGENILTSVFVLGWLRYGVLLHICSLIQSATHIWSLKPGSKYPPDDNLIFLISQTHWISYHQLAPWDYRTSEFGKYGTDCVTKFIKIFEVLELASDLKTIEGHGVREAVSKAVHESKPIKECLLESHEQEKKNTISKLCC